MKTGDGLLVRLNPVVAGLPAKALIGLCKAAQTHGNGIVEVTARGSIQIRGLTESSALELAGCVNELGIAVRTGVPVQTSVLAGLDPQEIANPGALCDMIRAGIAEAGLEGSLGPKVSVVVVGGGRSALGDVAADVRLTAEGAGVWRVAVAGNALTARPLGQAADDTAACAATLVLLSEIAARGRETRARDLEDNQLHGVFSALHPVRPEGRANGRDLAGWLVGIVDLRNGNIALGVALPFGHTTAKLLKTFAKAAMDLGIDDVRPAPGRALVAICGTRDGAEKLHEVAQALGFVTSQDDPRLSVSACPGAPDCASGHLPARQMAAEMANDYRSLLDGSAHLHVSGCAKGCAHPGEATLALVGSEAGTGLVVAGTARDQPIAYANSGGAGRAFATVAKHVAAHRRDDETTAQAIQRIGVSVLAEAFGQGGR
ncbi:MAG: precorrin-3B synthase [Hyphomicrobiales bacterium]|nr:precorrin-3B synthase [Hyphomicrobiales bacterium]